MSKRHKVDKEFTQESAHAFESNLFADATVIAGEGADQKTFRVNRFALAQHSEYFRSCFSVPMSESETGVLVKPNISSQIMCQILRFLYTGEIEITADALVPLFSAADELGLTVLQKLVLDSVSECIAPENVFRVMQAAVTAHNERISDAARAYILEHAQKVFDHPSFLELDEPSLIYFLESDDLVLPEELVWKCMLRWGCHEAQAQGVECDLNSLVQPQSSSSRDAVKQVLTNIVPLLRVYQLSSEVLLTQVHPTGILPQERVFNACRYLLKQSTIPKGDISLRPRYGTLPAIPDCPRVILAQIYQEIGLPFRLDLLYLGSRDGFTLGDFREKCGGQAGTLTFVHVKGEKEGERYTAAGYQPSAWSSESHLITGTVSNHCILFAINPPNGQGFTPFVPAVKTGVGSVVSRYSWPIFGDGTRRDLALLFYNYNKVEGVTELGNGAYRGKGASPTLFFGKSNFLVEEISVYKLNDRSLPVKED